MATLITIMYVECSDGRCASCPTARNIGLGLILVCPHACHYEVK